MKNMKRIALILMAAVLLMTLCSCGSSAAPDSVVGTWKCTNAGDFVNKMLDQAGMGGVSVNADINLELKADGTYSMSMKATIFGVTQSDNIGSGRYTYSDGKLTLDGQVSANVNGNTFKISGPIQGVTVTLEFKKQ